MTQSGSAPANWQVAVPTVIPIVLVIYLVPVLGQLAEHHRKAIPIALVAACSLLVGTAVWLNHVLLRRLVGVLPFLAAAVGVLLVWWWQWEAYSRFVPAAGLPYGYFLKPDGAQARLWVLVRPFTVGTVSMLLCCVSALVYWWRSGLRLLLLCMIPWWFVTFVVFALPSFYLDGQGNASLFI